MILEIIVFLAIAVFSYFDLKEHAVPSFMTTTLILALLLILPQNLIWGVSAFTFGWLLYEFDFAGGKFFSGIADVKVITIIGLMISTLSEFATLMIATTGFSVVLSIILYYKNGKKVPDEIPFIPVLLVVYLAVLSVRLFA